MINLTSNRYQQVIDRLLSKNVCCLNSDYGEIVLISLLIFFGSALQGYASQTICAHFTAVFFATLGYVIANALFPGKRCERRTFLLTYGICLFVGGLSQIYSGLMSNVIQSTDDAAGFFSALFDTEPYYTWNECKHLYRNGHPVTYGSPLPVFVWQRIYHFFLKLGFDYGLYIGTMFNAFIMGLSGSITIHVSRIIVGNDSYKLNKTGKVFSCCGLFWLFGSILLRDCFTVLINVLMLWGIVKWLKYPRIGNFLFSIVLTGASAYLMAYVRYKTIFIFGLIYFLGVICWLLSSRLNLIKLVIMVMLLIMMIMIASFIMPYYELSKSLQAEQTEKYIGILESGHTDNSLGMRLIVSQPIPIRLLLGSITRLSFPLPLWGYLKRGVKEYSLLMTINGIFQIVVMPLFITGCIIVFQSFIKEKKNYSPIFFMVVYFIVNYEAVIATSFEQRHIGQFMPAFCVVSGYLDYRKPEIQKILKKVKTYWYSYVVVIHFLYVLLKGML